MLSLVSELAKLGMAAPSAAAVAHAASGFEEDGMRARLAQLRFGIDKEVLGRKEALDLVAEQPWFFSCAFGTAFENELVVATDKPFDTHLCRDEAGPRWDGELTLREWLKREHPATLTEDGAEVRTCHNLDFATSGVIVAAKSREAANDVSRCFRDRLARKLYCALVFGHPTWETATWDARIMPSQRRFKQRISGGGKRAETRATVGARGTLRMGEHAGRDATLLWLEPRTGRRHQLRLHCSHAGHGIVGDLTYANDRLMYRMMLHAAALELPLQLPPCEPHAPVRIEAPLEPGWAHCFEPAGGGATLDEAVRNPEGWPDAAARLLGA